MGGLADGLSPLVAFCDACSAQGMECFMSDKLPKFSRPTAPTAVAVRCLFKPSFEADRSILRLLPEPDFGQHDCSQQWEVLRRL